MWTLQRTNDGKAGGFALGFVVSGSGNGFKVSHNGSQEETKTRLVLYPRRRHGMVVVSNCQHADPARISTAVYSTLAKVRQSPRRSPSARGERVEFDAAVGFPWNVLAVRSS